MKSFSDLFCRVALCAFLLNSASSCVNHIAEEGENNFDEGNIPLTFVANIQEVTHARVAGNQFGENDEVGLFALAGNTTMQEERYADNLHFVRSADGAFVADESVYYPDDGVTLNLISYYPYRKEGVAMGESTMPVTVAVEQDIPVNYSLSDFLIAKKENVQASKDAIALTYKHQFFKLKIALTPGEGENIEALLTANPQLSVSGFYTKTVYDFQDDSYSEYSEEKNIVPAGEWKIEDGCLVGKELILIPQETTAGYQYVTLEVGGKAYSSLLPSTLKLESGKQRELNITFLSDEDILMSKVDGSIDDWEGTETDQAESETIHKYVDVSKLTFEQSNVYKVLHAGKQVAEICKEYLVTSDFASQAIVAYPMNKETQSVDLSKGIVVQLLGQSGKVHGGSVSWNMEKHSLEYTAGTLAARNYVYVLADGQLSVSISMADDVQSVLSLPDVARDVRGGMIQNYPIVKIGTQYWMRENLKASLYNDGEKIPKLTVMVEGATGYLQSNVEDYYYSSKAVSTNKLALKGWSVPQWEDWDLLKAYLKEDASTMKSGKWEPIKEEAVTESNNKSGFTGIPTGFAWASYPIADLAGRYLGFWTLDEAGALSELILSLKSSSNEISRGSSTPDKAFCIRCVRQ